MLDEYTWEPLLSYADIDSLVSYAFSDPLTDNTRKRQLQLLSSSVVILLWSLSILDINGGTILGLKLTVKSKDFVQIAFGFICLYFLVSYLIAASADLKLYTIRMTSQTELHRRVLASSTARQTALLKIWDSLSDTDKYEKRTREIKEKFAVLISPLEEQRTALLSEMENLSPFEMKEYAAISQRESELFRKIYELSHEETIELSKIYDADVKESSGRHSLVMADGAKAALLMNATRYYIRLKSVRFWLEVFFPIVFAMVSIGSAIYTLNHY